MQACAPHSMLLLSFAQQTADFSCNFQSHTFITHINQSCRKTFAQSAGIVTCRALLSFLSVCVCGLLYLSLVVKRLYRCSRCCTFSSFRQAILNGLYYWIAKSCTYTHKTRVDEPLLCSRHSLLKLWRATIVKKNNTKLQKIIISAKDVRRGKNYSWQSTTKNKKKTPNISQPCWHISIRSNLILRLQSHWSGINFAIFSAIVVNMFFFVFSLCSTQYDIVYISWLCFLLFFRWIYSPLDNCVSATVRNSTMIKNIFAF